jgi:hypothetical protein
VTVSIHCPLLYKLMHEGIEQGNKNFDSIYPYQTKVLDDVVFRIWRYKSFEEEYALAKQFNYEYKILSCLNNMSASILLDCKEFVLA